MKRAVLIFALVLPLAACGDDDDKKAVKTQNVTLNFQALVDGNPAQCGTTVTGVGTGNSEVQLADARFFVSGVELKDADGNWQTLEMTESNWQHMNVGLLDFEDGTSTCADSGTADLNRTITGTVPEGTYDGVRFDVGIPFELNHSDTATAPAPFNTAGMFWNWQGGYKFVRVDFMVTGGQIPRWNVHIGSTGCVSAAPTVSPAEACAKPNLTTITLPRVGGATPTGFDPDTGTILVDLLGLVDTADVSVNTTDTPPGCMSMPMEPNECTTVYGALGLDFSTGLCTTSDCSAQDVFSSN